MKPNFTPEQIIERREARKAARKEQKALAELDSMRLQKQVNSVTITIEWKKSRMWGSNPSATGKVSYKNGSFGEIGPFTCSGAGYDKESTVIADVFNETLRYKLFQKIKGEAPYGMYYYAGQSPKDSYTDRDGKVVSYYKTPRYNGGVGTSCYYKIAEFIGGTFTHVASGKTFDVYEYKENTGQ